MRTKSYLLAGVLLVAMGTMAGAQEGDNLQLQNGPITGYLGSVAQINVPEGYVFADADTAQTIMVMMQNPVDGTELGMVGPPELEWFVLFEYDDVGYVKDDEKADLDASAMLNSIKSGNDASNKERKRRGWAPINITGWEQQPRYDDMTHNLEWAVRAESEGELIVNFNTRLLGRGGVMRVTLVTDPVLLPQILPDFRYVMQGYEFQQGQRYAEYRPGDKIAKYGLTALVVGGATAVALKSGLLKYIWKGLVVVVLGAAAFVKKFFKRE